MQTQHVIAIFEQVIIALLDKAEKRNPENIVIGGTVALAAHGLNLDRKPGDLDLVIYSPSEEQYKYLELLSVFALGKQSRDMCIRGLRSIKFKRAGEILNILIEKDTFPESNLLYTKCYKKEGGFMYLQMQSISKVIEAKNSYRINPHSVGLTGNRYARVKDYYDCQQLKNLNFNVPFDAEAIAPVEEDGYNE